VTAVLWLSGAEVERLGVTPDEWIALAEHTLKWHAETSTEVPPKLGVHPPAGRHILAMPALVAPLGAVGMKWISDFPGNRPRGLPSISGLIILNDPATGFPRCVMDAGVVTAWRTAAVTGVAVRACARHPVETVGLIGTGAQARSHLAILWSALPRLRHMLIAGRDQAKAVAFCAAQQRQGMVLIPVGSPREAIVDSDVIVTLTSDLSTSLLEPEWVKLGATVIVLDNAAKETRMLAAADRVVVDDRAGFESEEGRRRFPSGFPKIDADIGEVLLGRKPGRTAPRERVLIVPLGIGALDIAGAVEVYQRAVTAGVGTMVSL